MKMLSVGIPSTLGNWRGLCLVAFGEESKPVKYFDTMIEKEGPEAEVIADEAQLLNVCIGMMRDEEPS